MNYKKMWNKLKEEMILKKEEDEKNVISDFIRADEILMFMVKAEVEESKVPERQLDIPLASLLGGKK